MATTEHGRADGHEVCHCVFAIADELRLRVSWGVRGGVAEEGRGTSWRLFAIRAYLELVEAGERRD